MSKNWLDRPQGTCRNLTRECNSPIHPRQDRGNCSVVSCDMPPFILAAHRRNHTINKSPIMERPAGVTRLLVPNDSSGHKHLRIPTAIIIVIVTNNFRSALLERIATSTPSTDLTYMTSRRNHRRQHSRCHRHRFRSVHQSNICPGRMNDYPINLVIAFRPFPKLDGSILLITHTMLRGEHPVRCNNRSTTQTRDQDLSRPRSIHGIMATFNSSSHRHYRR